MMIIRRLLCRARCHGCLRQIWTPCSTPIPTMEPGEDLPKTNIAQISIFLPLHGLLAEFRNARDNKFTNNGMKVSGVPPWSFAPVGHQRYFQGRGGRKGRRSRNVQRGRRTSRSRKGQRSCKIILKCGNRRYLSSRKLNGNEYHLKKQQFMLLLQMQQAIKAESHQ